ncbi:uncharacterized protein [Physcomitrium patens]|uniref:Uncharacterized protein n=2 Tax=Physcomitrium patens TaxID=3218 RepID=A0A7I4D6X1_PHYPA|nr:uncharacterized protein LOC112278031 [Physcomitrium patens]|eukprot:XP_024366792.1 uncharacterized protein LOC112278031 [Physcomitrella patens]
MHASNLLKAVLKPRTLSAASRQRSVSDGGRERRSLSPDNRLPPPVLAARKAASVAPVVKKMTCMCSPTNHPGSFRCRYHREMAAKAASAAVSFPRGRSPAPARPSTKSVGGDAQSNIIFSEVNRTLPGRASHISRSPTGRTSRLQKMTMGTGFEEEEELTCSISDDVLTNSNALSSMRRLSPSNGTRTSMSSFNADVHRENPTMFCQSTSRVALDVFSRSMSKMYL